MKEVGAEKARYISAMSVRSRDAKDNGPVFCRWLWTTNVRKTWGRVRRWSCWVSVKGEKILEGSEFPSFVHGALVPENM